MCKVRRCKLLINKHELLKKLEEHFGDINDIAEVIECINECEEKEGNLTGGFTRIVVETEEKNPKTIATITEKDIEPSEGFRVRLTPVYKDKDMVSEKKVSG